MIRAYRATYIKFDDEEDKKFGDYLLIEMINRKKDLQQVIVTNKSHLVMASKFSFITEIKGYHHYKVETDNLSNFGIGGLSSLRTNHPEGMLEGLAQQTSMNYQNLAVQFGRGLLEAPNYYTSFIEID